MAIIDVFNEKNIYKLHVAKSVGVANRSSPLNRLTNQGEAIYIFTVIFKGSAAAAITVLKQHEKKKQGIFLLQKLRRATQGII